MTVNHFDIMQIFLIVKILLGAAIFLFVQTASAQQAPAPSQQQIYDAVVAELTARERQSAAVTPEEADEIMEALMSRFGEAHIVAIVEVLLAMAPAPVAAAVYREAAIRAVPGRAAALREARATRFVFLTQDGIGALRGPLRLPFAAVDSIQEAGTVVSPADLRD